MLAKMHLVPVKLGKFLGMVPQELIGAMSGPTVPPINVSGPKIGIRAVSYS